jgi:hypothetical protein
MHTVTGGCHCGNLLVQLQLARPPDTYHPRACDCDFCLKHGAAYVSDPHGSLLIRVGDERQAGKYTQGSGQAELLLCRNCGVLVGALYRDGGRLYATVNATVIDGAAKFGARQPVSPKSLSDRDKAQRWREIWFPDVSMVTGDA